LLISQSSDVLIYYPMSYKCKYLGGKYEYSNLEISGNTTALGVLTVEISTTFRKTELREKCFEKGSIRGSAFKVEEAASCHALVWDRR